MHIRPIVPVEQAHLFFLAFYGKTINIRRFSPTMADKTCLIWSDRFDPRTEILMLNAGRVGRKMQTLVKKDMRFRSIIEDLLRTDDAYDAYQRDYPNMSLAYYIASRFKDPDLKALAPRANHRLRKDFDYMAGGAYHLCAEIRKIALEIWQNPDADDEEKQYMSDIEDHFGSDKINIMGAPSATDSVLSGIDFALPMEALHRSNTSHFHYIQGLLGVVTHAFRDKIAHVMTPEQTARLFVEVSAQVRQRSTELKNEYLRRIKEEFNVSTEYAQTLARLSAIRRTGSGPRNFISADEKDEIGGEYDPVAEAEQSNTEDASSNSVADEEQPVAQNTDPAPRGRVGGLK